MRQYLSKFVVWATQSKVRYATSHIVLGNVAVFTAVTVWLLPLALLTIIPVIDLNGRRATFINVPQFIAVSGTTFYGLIVLLLGYMGLVSQGFVTAPPWSLDVLGYSWVGCFGGLILCLAILTFRYGSPYDEPGPPPTV